MNMTWRRGTAYSQDLRDRVLAYSDAGELVGEIATALCVSISYVSKVISRRAQTGELCAPAAMPCSRKARRALRGHPNRGEGAADATLGELRRWLAQTHEVTASNG